MGNVDRTLLKRASVTSARPTPGMERRDQRRYSACDAEGIRARTNERRCEGAGDGAVNRAEEAAIPEAPSRRAPAEATDEGRGLGSREIGQLLDASITKDCRLTHSAVATAE